MSPAPARHRERWGWGGTVAGDRMAPAPRDPGQHREVREDFSGSGVPSRFLKGEQAQARRRRQRTTQVRIKRRNTTMFWTLRSRACGAGLVSQDPWTRVTKHHSSGLGHSRCGNRHRHEGNLSSILHPGVLAGDVINANVG